VVEDVTEMRRPALAGTPAAATAVGSGAQAPATTAATSPGSPSYSYYRSMMSSYYGGSSMMGGAGTS
jgi:hypothetical protein